MSEEKNRRSTVLIEPELQLWALIVPLVVVVSTSLFLFLLFYFQSEGLKGALANPELLAQVQKGQFVLGITVAVILLLHIGMIFWVGLKATHKFAGPIYRFKKTMQEIADGARGIRITLREKDKLKDMAADFNRMMDVLEGEATDDKEPEPEEVQEAEPKEVEQEEGD